MTFNNTFIRNTLQQVYNVMLEVEDELAQLDSIAGDGDHGAGMVRGFRAALDSNLEGDLSTSVMAVGKAFSNAAGGSSGALFGMFIMQLGRQLPQDGVTASHVAHGLQAGLDAICQLGKAKVGDKTMIDTLVPFVEAYHEAATRTSSVSQAWTAALPQAAAGMEATKDMTSRRGRASKLGDRSLGHIDPGARSMYYIIHTVEVALRREGESAPIA